MFNTFLITSININPFISKHHSHPHIHLCHIPFSTNLTSLSRASDIDRSDEPKFLILMSNRHTPAKLHQQAWVIFVNCLYCTWCCFACSAITHKNSSQLRSFNLSICKPCVINLQNQFRKIEMFVHLLLFRTIFAWTDGHK